MAFLLIALSIVICLTTLAGGTLLFIGMLKKNRLFRRSGTILIVSSLIGLAAFCTFASVKVFHKLKSASPKEYWRAIVDAAFDDTAIRPLDPVKAKHILSGKVGSTAFLATNDVQGVWVEGVVLSYGYFLYVADEKEVLSAVASAPIDSSFQLTSDTACREITWDECKKMMLYEKGPQRNLSGWMPEDVAEKRCYSCLRCPWSHTILIDGKTGKLYHSISEIRE